ncbi:Major sperm protein [Aphelenchoides besseyi]|nr:Major sperm protein [Aphelenchoides besseyi]
MFDEDRITNISLLRKRIRENPNICKYNPNDLKRAELEDYWLESFLVSRNYDLDITSAVFFECLKFRQNFGVQTIGFLELQTALELSFIYFRGNDLEGNRLLWFNFKNFDETANVSRLLIYWLERHVTDTENQPVAVFLNFSDTSAQKMGDQFLKFMFHSFKYYYPNSLKRIYVYEIPIKLSAPWRLIRQHMDQQTSESTINLSSRNITTFVPMKYIPKIIGGEDDFTFTISELARCTGSPNAKRRFSHPINKVSNKKLAIEKKKAVQFEKEYTRCFDLNTVSIFDRTIDWKYQSFLAIAPKRSLVLNCEKDRQSSVNIMIQSMSAWYVYFNVGINSRRRLEVCPQHGVLEPTERAVVTIRTKDSIRTPRKYKIEVQAIRVREQPDLSVELPDVYRENAEDRVKFYYDCFVNTRQEEISEKEFLAEERNGFVAQESLQKEVIRSTPAMANNWGSKNNVWPLFVLVDVILLFIVIYMYS